jgi:hypothetical protein
MRSRNRVSRIRICQFLAVSLLLVCPESALAQAVTGTVSVGNYRNGGALVALQAGRSHRNEGLTESRLGRSTEVVMEVERPVPTVPDPESYGH